MFSSMAYYYMRRNCRGKGKGHDQKRRCRRRAGRRSAAQLNSIRYGRLLSSRAGRRLLDPLRPSEALSEEFGTLRTQAGAIESGARHPHLLVTSSSPGEGKSFTASNLALAEAQLEDNPTLLCDFDLRQPQPASNLSDRSSPGISDYLLGPSRLSETIQRIGDSNLFVMTAGEPVINPLDCCT